MVLELCIQKHQVYISTLGTCNIVICTYVVVRITYQIIVDLHTYVCILFDKSIFRVNTLLKWNTILSIDLFIQVIQVQIVSKSKKLARWMEVKIRPLPNIKIDRPLLAFPFSTNTYYFTY